MQKRKLGKSNLEVLLVFGRAAEKAHSHAAEPDAQIALAWLLAQKPWMPGRKPGPASCRIGASWAGADECAVGRAGR